MSYILEALKKSDQQRQRGATPTLPAAQVTVAAPKRSLFIYYGLLAAVLLGAGITIGWLRPWQAEQPAPATEPSAARSPTPYQAAPSPLPEPPEMATKTAQELSTPPVAQPAPRVDAMKSDTPASASTGTTGAVASTLTPLPEKTASPAQEQRAIPMAELPLPIQQEIPAMTIQLHAYSGNPSERLVSINSRMLREGGSLTPDLRLEQITPDGMIFSYKGYRFQSGVR